jgi:hypothetical protein
MNGVCCCINSFNCCHTESDRFVPEQFAKGIADTGRLEKTGRHLINERGEIIVIVFIYQHNRVMIVFGQVGDEIQPCKSAADHYYPFFR